ncbi:hypothetical protein OCEANICA350_20071 [Oceanicaulis sp. 350]|nr:hypothetical protein OCEANICA350_20071 [Oceanicaulis sp. 350]
MSVGHSFLVRLWPLPEPQNFGSGVFSIGLDLNGSVSSGCRIKVCFSVSRISSVIL